MQLTSPAFTKNGLIPPKYTCDGDNVSPPLSIIGIPENTKSLVLIMEDPDVPRQIREDGMWDHWLCWNIPPDTTDITEATEPRGVVGTNTSGNKGYGVPALRIESTVTFLNYMRLIPSSIFRTLRVKNSFSMRRIATSSKKQNSWDVTDAHNP